MAKKSRVGPKRRHTTPISDGEPAPRPAQRKPPPPPPPQEEEFEEPEELEPGEMSEPEMGEELEEGAGTLFEASPPKAAPPPPPGRRRAPQRLKGDPAAMVDVTATDADRFTAARAELISELDEALELAIDLQLTLPGVESGVCVTRLREARWWACEIDPTP